MPYIELFRELKTRFRYTTGLVYITHLFWHLEAIGSKVPAFKNEFNSQELKPREIFVALHPWFFWGRSPSSPLRMKHQGPTSKSCGVGFWSPKNTVSCVTREAQRPSASLCWRILVDGSLASNFHKSFLDWTERVVTQSWRSISLGNKRPISDPSPPKNRSNRTYPTLDGRLQQSRSERIPWWRHCPQTPGGRKEL